MGGSLLLQGPSAGLGRDREGRDGAETQSGCKQVAPGRRHARRASWVGGGEKFLPNFPTQSLRGRGTGSAGAFGRWRPPGPSAARAGVGRLRQRGPAGSLPAVQPRSHESLLPRLGVARRGRRAEARPAGPSPSSTSSSRAPGCSDDGTAAPHSLLQEEGIPGLPHPSSSLSTSTQRSARPHPRLRPSSAGAEPGVRAGVCGYLCARPACSPELAPRPPELERPPPSGAGARSAGCEPSLAVPVGCWSESLLRTQHGGGVRGGFPWRRRLRGREEEVLLACGERTHSAPSPSADPSAAHSSTPRGGERGTASAPSAFLGSLHPL